MDNVFTDAFERLLTDLCTPQTLLALEQAGSASQHTPPADAPDRYRMSAPPQTHATLWAALEDSGFLDCLVPEQAGGAGMTPADALPLLMAAGRHALPTPFGATLLARGWLAHHGCQAPPGAIAIASAMTRAEDGGIRCSSANLGLFADWLLAPDTHGRVALWPCRDAQRFLQGGHGSLDVCLAWPAGQLPDTLATVQASADVPRLLGALGATCLMAGAAQGILAMTVEYANQRQQFGRAIGRFQAIQQPLSEMAELAGAMHMAAQLACQADPSFPSPKTIAIGTCLASGSANRVADISHAVHGAIGITQEYGLQPMTRRLREWRRAYGTQAYWAEQVGHALLDTPPSVSLLDYLQAEPGAACCHATG